MRHAVSVPLCRHPDTPCRAIEQIDVTITPLADGSLSFDYRLHGNTAALAIPPEQTPGAADGLWQHTCCEAFIARPDEPAYGEFNFSPSGQWAAYRFSGYRQRSDWQAAANLAPGITVFKNADELHLRATLPAELLPQPHPGGNLQLALSCVIEAADGNRSYWALTHPPGQPDFHQRSNFTLNLSV